MEIFDVMGEFNWLAILVSTVVYFMMGALWFARFGFGRIWDRALGFDRPHGWKPAPLYYIGPLMGSLVATLATATLIYAFDITTAGDAVMLGLVVGIGYAGMASVVNAITPNIPKPLLLGAVTGAYHTLCITLAALVLFAWR